MTSVTPGAGPVLPAFRAAIYRGDRPRDHGAAVLAHQFRSGPGPGPGRWRPAGPRACPRRPAGTSSAAPEEEMQ